MGQEKGSMQLDNSMIVMILITIHIDTTSSLTIV